MGKKGKISVDPHFGSSHFLNFLQVFLLGGGLSRSHVLLHGWLPRNQGSVFEGQSEVDTCRGEFAKKLQNVVREATYVILIVGDIFRGRCFIDCLGRDILAKVDVS